MKSNKIKGIYEVRDKEGLEEITNGDEFMEEYKKKIIDLNEEETFRSWMTKEEDDKMILNTEKSLSFKEGIEEGAVQSKIEIVREMLRNNMEIPLISKITKLSEEEIRKIKNSDLG